MLKFLLILRALGGTSGVMVIIVRNEHSNMSSNPTQSCLRFTEH